MVVRGSRSEGRVMKSDGILSLPAAVQGVQVASQKIAMLTARTDTLVNYFVHFVVKVKTKRSCVKLTLKDVL